jgi:glycerophosphoryl diester phosphodiesterase
VLRSRFAFWLVPLLVATGCGLGNVSSTGLATGPIPPISLLGLGPSDGNPLIVGHRGGSSGKAPENTMAAFRLGPTQGAAILECDIHCSQDGALVVIHDSTVDRTTNGKGPVHKLTLAQLKALDAGGGERIPTLDELLDWTAAQPGLKLVVEIKAKRKVCPDIADKVVEAINRKGVADRTLVISFHRHAVERVEQTQPALRTGLLFMLRLNPIRTAKAVHADMVWPGRQRTTSRFVRSAKEAGLGVFSWTLNTGHHVLEARRVGADAVVTDYPDVAKDAFEHGTAPLPIPGASESYDPEDREDPEDLAAEEGR